MHVERWSCKLNGIYRFRDLGLLGRIILNWFWKNNMTGLIRVKKTSLAGFCEHDNEPDPVPKNPILFLTNPSLVLTMLFMLFEIPSVVLQIQLRY
jgi:hypothetical protein